MEIRGGRCGTAGTVVPDGTLPVAAGSELSALAPKTLKSVGSYKTEGAEFTSSPVVFQYKEKDLVAVASNDGRLHLLDAAALNKSLDRQGPPPPRLRRGSLTSWQDPRWNPLGVRPSGGAIAAWKVVRRTARSPGRRADSRAPGLAARPDRVNGAMFALSSGEYRSNDAGLMPSAPGVPAMPSCALTPSTVKNCGRAARP
jgi:hypothetical protein